MLGTYVISLALMGLCGLLLDSHRRSWRHAQESADLPAREKRYALSQYRRRMQASGTIGLVGAAIAVGPLVPHRPGPMTLYLAALLAACAWIMLMALLDFWATRQHYNRIRSEQLTAQVRLAMELRAAEQARETDSGNSAADCI
jgi:hypothetical protein